MTTYIDRPVGDGYIDIANENSSNVRYMSFPQLRYMGSKHRLLPWIETVLSNYDYSSVLDAFSGSGAVSYMFKTLGKKVISNDFLRFSHFLSRATVENSSTFLAESDIELLVHSNSSAQGFIRKTFNGIFFEADDLEFLDNVSASIKELNSEHKRALAFAALFRSCVKKQPRGVFTISGTLEKYNDGRRDLKLSLREHFLEQIEKYNAVVFDNGQYNISLNEDVFSIDTNRHRVDLVYLDPPYIPRSDDNCYTKRYHFLEGLSDYWQSEEILMNTKVRKITKKFTPFSYRKDAELTFDRLFQKFSQSTIALSYSSNSQPDLEVLVELLQKYKSKVDVFRRDHRYHFGNHTAVKRAVVEEYLIVGS